MFKYSIIHDIVKVTLYFGRMARFAPTVSNLFPQGMLYIHTSDLQSHGNLKSTNCLVGSRVRETDI